MKKIRQNILILSSLLLLLPLASCENAGNSIDDDNNASSSTEISSSSSDVASSTYSSSSSNEPASSPSVSSSPVESNNTFLATGKFDYPRRELTYAFGISGDYDNFSLYDNTLYHNDLAELGVVLSTSVYGVITTSVDGIDASVDEKQALFDAIGMQDYQLVDLTTNQYILDQDDTAKFQLAHHSYIQDGVSKEVIFLVFSGTATKEEWSSNMDLGCCADYYKLTKAHPEYTDLTHHKGIEVAYQRALPYVENYLKEHSLISKENSLFITGHSRGAGIANLMGAHFEKEDNIKTFTYTFASPRVSCEEDTTRATIFNVVNQQDFVGGLAPKEYGFKRYGNDVYFSSADFKKTFESETGLEYHSLDVQQLNDKIIAMSPTVDDLYHIKEDEDHELFSTARLSGFNSRGEAEKRINNLVENYLFEYSKDLYSVEIVKEDGKYSVKAYDSPALVLQAISLIANSASDTEEAAKEIIRAAIIFAGTQIDLLSYFVSHGTGLGVNHEMFTYMAGLNHLEQN